MTVLNDVVPGLKTVKDVGRTPSDQHLQVGVSLLGQSKALRDEVYTQMFTPGSSTFGHTMTSSQVETAFAVSPALAANVREWATAQGLTVGYTSTDGSYLLLDGTVAEVDKTFAVTEEQFTDAKGQAFRAATSGATVPAGVDAVLGLTDLTKAHVGAKISQVPATTTPATAPPYTQTNCLAACMGILTPQDLWSVYDEPDSDMGTGQQVGIFGEGELDTIVSDVAKFQVDHDLARPDGSTVPIRRVLVDDNLSDASGDDEWDLDSDAITGMSPKLDRLNYYFGQDLTDASIAAIYSAWVDDPDGPRSGNSSFGGCEVLDALEGGAAVDDALFQKAAMAGRTMFASTGDVGGSCGVGPAGVNGITNGGVPQVEYPASSPYVVAVGGSVLYTKADATTTDEVTPAQRFLEYAWPYTGGGISQAEPRPSDQSSIATITVPCVYTNAGGVATPGTICRGTPDVAAVSGDSESNGYTVYTGGAESEGGGTSLSSPLWASMWARVQADHPSTCATTYEGGSTDLGFAQPALYAVGLDQSTPAGATTSVDDGSFFDIGNTDGTSLPTGNGQQLPLPRSGADPSGWDYVSGLGDPDLQGIIRALDCGAVAPAAAATYYPADMTVQSDSSCNGVGADATGDAFPSNPLANSDDAADLVSSTITSTGSSLSWSSTVVNLNSGANESKLMEEFTYEAVTYYLYADVDGASSNAYELYKLVGTTMTPLATLTGSVDKAHNTISVVMPFSAFNTAVKPTAALGPGSALAVPKDLLTGGSDGTATDELDFTCAYIVPGGTADTTPPAVTPEAPYAVLLLLAGMAAVGAVIVRRRHGALAA